MKLVDLLAANENRTIMILADIDITDGKKRYARRRLIDAFDHEIKAIFKERDAMLAAEGLDPKNPIPGDPDPEKSKEQGLKFAAAQEKFQKYIDETDSEVVVEPLFTMDDIKAPTRYQHELSLDKLGVLIAPEVEEPKPVEKPKLVKKPSKGAFGGKA